MVPNPLNKLTEEMRARVVEVTTRTAAAISISSQDIETLFQAWEIMFPGDNQKRTCKACVNYVVSNFRRYVAMG